MVPAAPSPGGEGGDKLDLRVFWSMLRRRLGLFLGVLVTVLVLGLALTLMQTPRYIAAAQVSLNQRDAAIAPDSSTSRINQSEVPTNPLVDTQVQIITSRSMAERVVDSLKLGQTPRPASSGGALAWLRGVFGSAPPPAPAPDPAAQRQRWVTALQNSISAARVGQTLALIISYSSSDPEQAARIANEYALQYTGGQLVAKREQNESATSFLSGRLGQLRAQAQTDAERVQRYRIANNLLSTSGSSLTEQEISSYNQAVATARAQAAEDQAALDTARIQLRSGSRGDDVGAALGSGVVSSLRARQAEVGGLVANLSARYGPLHPDVVKAKSELAEINSQIQAEIGRVISNLEAKVRVSRQRLGSLSGSLSGAEGKLEQNNAAMVGLADLERSAQASQSLYESYLKTYQESGAREGTERADATVLSLAEVPTRPASPNILLNGLLALALGLGLGLAVAFIAEMTFSGLTTGEDVETRLGVRYLGLIPTLSSVSPGSKSPILSVIDQPLSAFAESFRNLRASIDYASDGQAKVIAVTSALPQEGKTTSSICLARSIAMSGERVVLVDCDLRRHGVSRYLRQAEVRPGLVEVLRGEASFQSALIRDDRTGMSVLPVLVEANAYGELLTGEPMDLLLQRLRDQFDSIILDTAPLLPIADARLVVGKADAAMMVVRWRKTPDQAVKSALRLLPSSRVQLAGIALTRVDMKKQAKFGYGDSGFYYQSYKGYYA